MKPGAIDHAARYKQAMAGIPLSADQVHDSIARLDSSRATPSARRSMASLCVKHGNFTDDARQLWADYLENIEHG